MTSKIDLSKYVGKKVRVTFRNGYKTDSEIRNNDKGYHKKSHPYILFGSCSYNQEGYTYCSEDISPSDIIHIEEIKEMDEIQELKNKVKELQEQIDRLEAQEQKQVPKIKCIEVTRTIVYDPESYLEKCLEDNITPSQSGFLKYMEDCFDDDFVRSHFYEQEIKELEVWNED
jgi:hypothetical protein